MNCVQFRSARCCLLPAVPSPGGGPTANPSRSACLRRFRAPAATRRPLRREAHCQAPTPHRASPRRQRCGTRHRKQDSTQMQQRCTQNTRMGRKPAWSRTADIAQPTRGSRADADAPVPSACLRVHLPASAQDLACCAASTSLLPAVARRSPTAAITPCTNSGHGSGGPGLCRGDQNPMHLFGSPRCSGRDAAPARANSHGPGARLAGHETRHRRDAGTLQVRHQRQNPMHLNDCSPVPPKFSPRVQ